MEVKSVYMDLQEGKKKGNVWKLESEAFKKPIEIKIWYDNKELAEFNARCEKLEWELKETKEENVLLHRTDADLQHWIQITQEEVTKNRENLSACMHTIEKMDSEIKSLYKVIADQKTRIETLSGTMLKIQETINEIQKKTTKQPSVFHWKCFISGRESSGLWMFELPDGDYLLNAKYTIGEHNEYVTNKDDIVFEKIHVENQSYVPFYKLEWGTELDTPTATIYYDLIFMPI